MERLCSKTIPLALVIVCSLLYSCQVKGYGLLSHEVIIDATWNKTILPLLKQKYPNAKDTELNEAREYVYGGSLIPDIGYYPRGNMFFTDMIHYVRSGDFIQALLDESQNLDEYAFALGVLCHYTADIHGHSVGTNRAVALLFPKKREEYGDVVTYEEGRIDHIRTEYCFDVLQTAMGKFSPKSYHDFIAFKISMPVLERAFKKTYSLDLKNYFSSLSVTLFRYAIKHIFEELTEDAWRLKKADLMKTDPLITERQYRYRIGRRDYNTEFGKPKLKSVFFYAIVKIMPKIGPLLIFKFKRPTPDVEKLYAQSLDTVIDYYIQSLSDLGRGQIAIMNKDYDTGDKTHPGEYGLADESYFKLAVTLEKNKFQELSHDLKRNVLGFYLNSDTLKFPKENSTKHRKLSVAIEQLKLADSE